MLMAVINPQSLTVVGDNRTADSAENGVLRLLLPGVFGLGTRCPGAR